MAASSGRAIGNARSWSAAFGEELLSTWRPSLVVAIDRWTLNDAVAPDGSVAKMGTDDHLALAEAALKKVAIEFTAAGSRLVFVELPPILAPECAEPAMGLDPGCRRRVDQDELDAPYNAAFRRIAAEVPGVATISISGAICPGGTCVMEVRGIIVRPDGTHFSAAVGPWLGDVIDQELAKATFRSR